MICDNIKKFFEYSDDDEKRGYIKLNNPNKHGVINNRDDKENPRIIKNIKNHDYESPINLKDIKENGEKITLIFLMLMLFH